MMSTASNVSQVGLAGPGISSTVMVNNFVNGSSGTCSNISQVNAIDKKMFEKYYYIKAAWSYYIFIPFRFFFNDRYVNLAVNLEWNEK